MFESVSAYICGFNGFNQINDSNNFSISSPTLVATFCPSERHDIVEKFSETSDVLLSTSCLHLSANSCDFRKESCDPRPDFDDDLNQTNKPLPPPVEISAPEDILSNNRCWLKCASILWDKILFLKDDGSVIFVAGIKSDMELNFSSIFNNKRFSSVSSSCQKIIGIDFNGKLFLEESGFLHEYETEISSIDQRLINVRSTDEGLLVFISFTKQLSLAKVTSELVLEWLPLNFNYCVKEVACGKHHVLALTVIGVVFSFGTGSQGQLGHGTISTEVNPRVVEALEGMIVLSIAAGGWHSMALSDFGDVYAWGWNNIGQLGLPCRNLSKEYHSTCNKHNSDGETKTGERLMTASDPTDGFVNVQMLPRALDFEDTDDRADLVMMSKLACGSRHSVAVSDRGIAYSWGWNCYGQLGLGDSISRDKPTIVEFFKSSNLKVFDVCAGYWNTIFLLQNESWLPLSD